jgi:hypothetical protein
MVNRVKIQKCQGDSAGSASNSESGETEIE